MHYWLSCCVLIKLMFQGWRCFCFSYNCNHYRIYCRWLVVRVCVYLMILSIMSITINSWQLKVYLQFAAFFWKWKKPLKMITHQLDYWPQKYGWWCLLISVQQKSIDIWWPVIVWIVIWVNFTGLSQILFRK